MQTLKYALRYLPLLVLSVLLTPLYLPIFNGAYYAQYFAVTPVTRIPPSFRTSSTLYAIAARSTTEAWAVGGSFKQDFLTKDHAKQIVPTDGIIMHYQAPQPWHKAATVPAPLFALAFSNSQDGWAVGSGGIQAHYDGQNWNVIQNATTLGKDLYGVALTSQKDGWAIGEIGTILHFNGQQWTSASSPTSQTLHAITMLSPQDGWSVGNNGTILHLHNGSWTLFPTPITANLNAITMLSPDEGWATGEQNTILHYHNGSWNSVTSYSSSGYSDPEKNLTGIAMADLQHGFIVSQLYESSLLLTYQGEVWQTSPFKNLMTAPECTAGDCKECCSQMDPSTPLIPALYGITLLDPTTGWAVGNYTQAITYGKQNIIIYSYHNGQWQIDYAG